jgi:hypothetical protein
MTAQQYLLSQAEHCRRTAEDSSDPFVAAELQRLAAMFEQKARSEFPQTPDDRTATAA